MAFCKEYQKPESIFFRHGNTDWTPAFAGVTVFCVMAAVGLNRKAYLPLLLIFLVDVLRKSTLRLL